MFPLKPLSADQLYRHCDGGALGFVTTDELLDSVSAVGQDRMLKALSFGAGIRSEGFNIFVMAPEDSGHRQIVECFLQTRAATETVPPDCCYVYNFDQPVRPKLLLLPPGLGCRFARSLERLVDELRSAIPAVFETDEYRSRVSDLNQSLAERQAAAIMEVKKAAKNEGIVLLHTPTGYTLAPLKGTDVLDSQAFLALPEDERKQMQEAIGRIEVQLQAVLQEFTLWRKDTQEQLQHLNEEMVVFAAGNAIDELRSEFWENNTICSHIESIQQDLSRHVNVFLGHMNEGSLPETLLARYQLNLLVDNSETQGAPIIHEDLPNLGRTLGRVEHHVVQGALVSDFTLIRAGALHRANGGYLILDLRKLITQPMVWEALKRALFASEIRIESIERFYSLASTVSLEPEPVPLSVKVILTGSRYLYYLMGGWDPDFHKLFKVQADYSDEIPVNDANVSLYSEFIAGIARRHNLRALTADSVARVIEYSGRLAQDQTYLSAQGQGLADLLLEANYWAEQEQKSVIDVDAVQKTIDECKLRASRIHERMIESILNGQNLIDTDGAVIGQVNGLTVYDLGNYRFGRPARITATARLGRGQVIDIEREAKLGGAIHSKAVLLLSNLLGSRYAGESNLPILASIAFEQSYGHIEGDSASVAEACALLSAIARVPLKQCYAVTGSINQIGQVQPIGGVNEKIEGFFEICRARGFAKEQGVLIPATNRVNLMLSREVRDAVERNEFHIYAIETLDQALELLSGLPAGEQNDEGVYTKGSFSRRVQDRLKHLNMIQRDQSRDKSQTDNGKSADSEADEDPA
ncbi:Lon protease family protein [Nitrincola sp. MINF-07-Sa-05]|uniref:Lon protease family protein n=1 Tax=Nitrincola salilacus TaxID=3400273 RepID=UPI0039185C7A